MSGLEIKFDNLELSEYSSIYVRLRTVKSRFDNDNVNIGANGVHLKYGPYPDYTEVDILPMMLEKGMTHLESIYVGAKYCSEIGIYIDDIIFVKKEDAPVYEDFTLDANDLLEFVGTEGKSTYEGGNVANVDMSKVSVGTHYGKDNVLAFTSTSGGGGLYIDLREYLTNGKIVASQNFTVTITIYGNAGVGVRTGVIWGDNLQNHSWKNNWKTVQGGWVTYTITSDDLRALDNCSTVEMSGIYIALNTGNYSAAIESVKFEFTKPE